MTDAKENNSKKFRDVRFFSADCGFFNHSYGVNMTGIKPVAGFYYQLSVCFREI